MVFVDANAVLEIAIPGRPSTRAVAELLGQPASFLYVSTLTSHLVWYFSRKGGLDDLRIKEVMNDYKLLPLTPADYAWALANERDKDFEDAVQVAVALHNGCDQFVTLDRQLPKRYAGTKLQFVTPR